MRRIVLASASSARLRLLRAAGLNPEVIISNVDESVFAAESARSQVHILSEAKAAAVAERSTDALVIGCDSLLEFEGGVFGKPSSEKQALQWWRRMRGQEGILLTGHCLIDCSNGRSASGVATTVVRFGTPTDRELEAYVATGEPLQAAGSFTLDGRCAVFLDGVDGDPGNVTGISLPLLRDLMKRIGVEIVDLWS